MSMWAWRCRCPYAAGMSILASSVLYSGVDASPLKGDGLNCVTHHASRRTRGWKLRGIQSILSSTVRPRLRTQPLREQAMTERRDSRSGLRGCRGAVLQWAVGAFAIAMLGGPPAASAAVIYVDIVPDRVVEQGTFIFDVDNYGTRDLLFDQSLGCVGNCLSRASVSALNGAVLMSTLTDVTPMVTGAIIGPAASTFGNGGLLAQDGFSGQPPVTFSEQGLWDNGLTGFVGFRFVNASGTHYGWARVKVEETSNIMTVFDAAYEGRPDTPIVAGVVSEPGTMALILLGAGGLASRRRRPSGTE